MTEKKEYESFHKKLGLMLDVLNWIDDTIPDGRLDMSEWIRDDFSAPNPHLKEQEDDNAYYSPSSFFESGMDEGESYTELEEKFAEWAKQDFANPSCGTVGCFAGWAFTDTRIRSELRNYLTSTMPRIPKKEDLRELHIMSGPMGIQLWLANESPYTPDEIHEKIFAGDTPEKIGSDDKNDIIYFLKGQLQNLYEETEGEGNLKPIT